MINGPYDGLGSLPAATSARILALDTLAFLVMEAAALSLGACVQCHTIATHTKVHMNTHGRKEYCFQK